MLSGFEFEGIAFGHPTAGLATIPFFRWYHPTRGSHFYTIHQQGELATQAGYVSEGIAFPVYPANHPAMVNLHRWYNAREGEHFYTTHPTGEHAPSLGYVYEGIACSVFPYNATGSSPVYRWRQSGFMRNATFDPSITAAQKLRVLQRHAFAYYRSKICGSLSAKEKNDVGDIYRNRPVFHGIDANPNNNASAEVGGDKIMVNFNNLFPLGDTEIAMTLLHEMMHLAGYRHPVRKVTDIPGDNGPYYSTAPLRAELCIAGFQSDAGRETLRKLQAFEEEIQKEKEALSRSQNNNEEVIVSPAFENCADQE